MKSKLLRQLYLMSRYAFHGLVLQCILGSILIASDLSAQADRQSIEEIKVTIKINDLRLGDALQEIGLTTGFNFTYNESQIDLEQKINLDMANGTLGDLLREISRETELKFRRVNENIHVGKLKRRDEPVEELQLTGQGRTVNGKVTSTEDNEGLPGVNVIIKGTAQGTVTDVNGNYALDVPSEESILVFSSVGYVIQEEVVGTRQIINLVLETDIRALEEIIVVGYGTQQNSKVTAAVSQVSSEDLEITKRPVQNLQSALIGSTPGLIIEQSSGQLGAPIDVKVRQVSALQDRNALILIDGFEGSINDVNPNDIETVTVLKDAAATAIYGARSANGVVLVTTKKTNRNERFSLTYSFNFSKQTPARTAELANSAEFIKFSNEAAINEAVRNNPDLDPGDVTLPFSAEELARAEAGFYPETQWVDELYSENAGQMNHNIGISGGSAKTGYFMNVGYLDQNGLAAGSDNFKRYNLRLKVDTDITDWLTIGTNAFLTLRNTDNVPVTQGDNIRGRPFFPVTLADGTWVDKGAAGGEPNPVGQANSGSYDKDQRDAINVQLYAQIEPIEKLVFEGRVSYIRSNTFFEQWSTPYEFVFLDMDLNPVGEPITPQAADRNLTFQSGREQTINSWLTGRYSFKVSESHNFNALVGIQTQQGESIGVQASRFNYILPTLQDLKLGQEISGFGNSSNRGGNRSTLSYFGRLSYDYNNRYLAEVNFRADASSNFTANNRWGYFPAVSVGWNLKKESFMSGVSFIDVLKLRGSWGQNGDDGSIIAVEKVDFNPSGASLGGIVIPTMNLGQAINPDLKWETSAKTNLGLDLDMWEGRLGLKAEYFIDNRSDIITQLLTSTEGGLEGVLDNVYDAKSWGWEFDVSHINDIGKVHYFANFNLSFYNSEITNTEGVSPLNFSNTNYQDIGLPVFGNWFGYVTDGYFNSQADMDNHVTDDGTPIDQSSVVAQGDDLGRYLGGYKYVDQVTVDTNGDGVPDAKDGVINSDDQIVLKENTGDNFRFGFNLGVSYMGFTLAARFYGVLKGYEWWRSGSHLNPFTGDRASYVFQMDTWRPDNLDAKFPSVTASNIIPFDQNVSQLIQNNSYIKIKNINLVYTFNQNVLDKLKVIGGLDLYLSVENLGTIWTNNPAFETGWDPELGTGSFSYPLPLTTSIGANIKF